MNCREFEKIVCDLARERPDWPLIDPMARESGLEHLESCERCALRLADERTLNSGLEAVAETDRDKEASQGVEAALLIKFRQNIARDAAMVPSTPAAVHSWQWRPWALAAAALILIGSGLLAYRVNLYKRTEVNTIVTEATPAHSPHTSTKRSPGIQLQDDQNIASRSYQRPGRTPQPVVKKRGSNNHADRFVIREEMTLYAGDNEITTDFLPLRYGADQPPIESGQVIRVQMPRSALLKFGLPMNVERAGIPVKADLLVGEDGLAQAIRFVR